MKAIAVLGLAALSVAAVAAAPVYASIWPFGNNARYTQTFERDFDAAGIATLEIHVPSADLDLNPLLVRPQAATVAGAAARGDDVHVLGVFRGSSQSALDEVTLDSQRQGDRLVLTLQEPRWRGFSSGKLTVGSPPGMKLRIFDSSGDVRIAQPRGEVMVRSSSGDVHVDQPSGAVDVGSSSGDVTVRGARSSLTVRSSSGDVTASLDPNWSGTTLALGASSGDVRLALPPNFRGHLESRVSSGSVHNGYGLAKTGGGVAVSVETSSGDIWITALR